jgi:hypothetical protein
MSEPETTYDVTDTPDPEPLTLEPPPPRKRRGRRHGVTPRPAVTRELPKNVWVVYQAFTDNSLAPARPSVHVFGATGDAVKALDWVEENPGAEVISAVIEP